MIARDKMAEPEDFQCVQGGLGVFPYHPRAGAFKEADLLSLYERLKEEDLFDVVFHENPELTALEFLNFFNMPRNLLVICGVVEDGKFDVAGMAWLSEITNCQDRITRGSASFVCFKKYQLTQHLHTFGHRVLEYWFDYLKINTIIGLTPLSNRPALAYIKRIGFRECGHIPNFTTLLGVVTDAIVTYMTDDEFKEAQNGRSKCQGS